MMQKVSIWSATNSARSLKVMLSCSCILSLIASLTFHKERVFVSSTNRETNFLNNVWNNTYVRLYHAVFTITVLMVPWMIQNGALAGHVPDVPLVK